MNTPADFNNCLANATAEIIRKQIAKIASMQKQKKMEDKYKPYLPGYVELAKCFKNVGGIEGDFGVEDLHNRLEKCSKKEQLEKLSLAIREMSGKTKLDHDEGFKLQDLQRDVGKPLGLKFIQQNHNGDEIDYGATIFNKDELILDSVNVSNSQAHVEGAEKVFSKAQMQAVDEDFSHESTMAASLMELFPDKVAKHPAQTTQKKIKAKTELEQKKGSASKQVKHKNKDIPTKKETSTLKRALDKPRAKTLSQAVKAYINRNYQAHATFDSEQQQVFLDAFIQKLKSSIKGNDHFKETLLSELANKKPGDMSDNILPIVIEAQSIAENSVTKRNQQLNHL